ncbi:MAG TPA: 2-oxoacid:ferredoxin oxidoreductase subunit gamma [Firmicutes bacterium]|nr:2-oxoacid:ferredoxin oxidoreductase subunit gamma [Bacillota bacterium]
MWVYAELRLSGSGGQGLMLAGQILAEAAGVYEGHHVVQTRSYGPEARGGASRSEVIISDQEIDYPEVTAPDIVLAMTQEAASKYHSDLKPEGILIIDPQFVYEPPRLQPGQRLYAIPLTALAAEKSGRKVTANMVALGVICALGGLVGPAALERAVLARVPCGTEDMNRRALQAGLEAARACQEGAVLS